MNRETGQIISGESDRSSDHRLRDYSQESREDMEKYLLGIMLLLGSEAVPRGVQIDDEEMPDRLVGLLQYTWELREDVFDEDYESFNHQFYDKFRDFIERFEAEKQELEQRLKKIEGQNLNRMQEKEHVKLRAEYQDKFGEFTDNSEYYEAKRRLQQEEKEKELIGRAAHLLQYFSAEDTAVIFSQSLEQQNSLSDSVLSSEVIKQAQDLVNDWYEEHEGEEPLRQLESEK